MGAGEVDDGRPAVGVRLRRVMREHRVPLVAFPAISVVLMVTQYLASDVLGRSGGFPPASLSSFLDGWVQYDGHSYIGIATNGYSYDPTAESNVVWFPLYPLLIRAGSVLVDPMFAGIAITLVAGFVGTQLWWRWLGDHDVGGSARVTAFFTMMLYPYAWFLYGPVYSDALFWALVLGAFLLLEADRPALAGLVGALATATRPSGVALIAALVVASLERNGVLTVPSDPRGLVARFRLPVRFDRRRLSLAAVLPATCAAGIVGVMAFQWAAFGDPIAFVTNQAHYHPGRLPLLKLGLFAAWRDAAGDYRLPLTITAQALFALLVLCTIPAVARRFGWGYGTLVAVTVAIPTVTTTHFIGTGRYLLAAFPTAALVGEWLDERHRARACWLAVSAVAVVGLNMGFARSWYLS